MTDLSLSSFQSRVYRWALDCFGYGHVTDIRERAHRFIEEALELGQVCSVSREDAHALVDYVYARDVGELKAEIGGVQVTLAVVCAVLGVSMEDAGERELARVMLPEVMEVVRAKQQAKVAAGVGGALPGSIIQTADRALINVSDNLAGGFTHMTEQEPTPDASATEAPAPTPEPATEPAGDPPAESDQGKLAE